jgi:lysophospholipase L1-like esterase
MSPVMSVKDIQRSCCPEWIKKFALAGVSAFFVFLFAELLFRYMIPAWPFEKPLYIPDYLSARDAPLRWRFSSSVGRNSLGLRNREVGPKKPGTLRILVIGDSLVWSGETSSGELYTKLLEQRLNARSVGSVSSFEVINAGIPGYTTYQELKFLEIYGLDMEPDLVILGFVFNDVYYKYLHKPTKEKILSREPAAHLHHFNTDSFPGLLFARSHLAHQLVGMGGLLWKKIVGRAVFPFEWRGDFYLAWKDYGWDHARALIGEMRLLLRDKGVPLVILVFPISDQVNHEYRKLDQAYLLYPQQKIREICEEYAIPMLDLTEAIYREGGITLFRDYLHLNGKGNDIVTNELQKYVVDTLENQIEEVGWSAAHVSGQ